MSETKKKNMKRKQRNKTKQKRIFIKGLKQGAEEQERSLLSLCVCEYDLQLYVYMYVCMCVCVIVCGGCVSPAYTSLSSLYNIIVFVLLLNDIQRKKSKDDRKKLSEKKLNFR